MKENCTKLIPIMYTSCVNNHVKNENDGAYLKKDIQEKRGGSIRLSDNVNCTVHKTFAIWFNRCFEMKQLSN
jgi:hypothetical protein